jgi:hypothetical protein
MYLSGNGYRTNMKFFHEPKQYSDESDLIPEIYMTDYFYYPQKGNPKMKKLLDKELQIEIKI